jgi:hypothetical protein
MGHPKNRRRELRLMRLSGGLKTAATGGSIHAAWSSQINEPALASRERGTRKGTSNARHIGGRGFSRDNMRRRPSFSFRAKTRDEACPRHRRATTRTQDEAAHPSLRFAQNAKDGAPGKPDARSEADAIVWRQVARMERVARIVFFSREKVRIGWRATPKCECAILTIEGGETRNRQCCGSETRVAGISAAPRMRKTRKWPNQPIRPIRCFLLCKYCAAENKFNGRNKSRQTIWPPSRSKTRENARRVIIRRRRS